jgi:hypothetical protein
LLPATKVTLDVVEIRFSGDALDGKLSSYVSMLKIFFLNSLSRSNILLLHQQNLGHVPIS